MDSLHSKEKLEVINQIKEIYNFIRIKKFCRLIPEVRTNIAGALQDAKTKEDIAGIDGRITMNLRYSPELIKNIKENAGLKLQEIIRENQPENVKKREFSTMQWLIKESVNKTGKISDIIWDKGSIGKEPMLRLFAKTSLDMVKKLKIIFDLS